MTPLLKVKNLRVNFNTYLGKVEAVRDVSFEVMPGETVAIVGESGSGKSVTAQSILRLIPASGEVHFNGQELLHQPKKLMKKIRGKEIGMIFQDPMTSLNPTMRIGKQIIEMLKRHQKLSSFEAKQRAIELLHLVEISNPARRIMQYPHEFSGGMRQRVMIAISLACNPKLLIADEPTTALDVTIQAQILELMKTLQKKMKMSIILITHDLGIVAGMCDRVLVMYAGQIVESAPLNEIFSNPAHPYTRGLLRSVPRLDMQRGEVLEPIFGTPPNLLDTPKGCAFCPRCDKAMRICQSTPPPLTQLSSTQTVTCWEQSDETPS
ncbi:MAG: Oligopeptide transport ATP-binding protein OppD [Chlamydiales bacterium]|nr:Oligopeptide transport ATP-binding protein OppD [Chlamydiales bacterium]MCH9620445.1 Oligopeptide transport ATP-binding protein OppD [Chlamydiales bacterium]MCH9623431.1 Oligopeptide transport ATP-binding protein OppD [Chlamydiales bacterium]